MLRRRVILIVAALVLATIAGVAWWLRAGSQPRRESLTFERRDARIHATVIVPHGVDAKHPAPAVLVAHGLGSSSDDVSHMARALVRAGYVAVTWDSRGSGRSTGRVGIAAPEGEVADVSAIVDRLARRNDVQRDSGHPDDPTVAVVGTSHGGGTALLAAERDERIDVVVPIFAWWDLDRSLEPNDVLKLQWASNLFAAGSTGRRRAEPCANLADDPCRAWLRSAPLGRFTPDAKRVLAQRSPATDADQLDIPTLIVQGQMDSLFDLREATDMARAVRRNHAPVRVEWVRGGHDLPLDARRREHVQQAVLRWLARHLEHDGGVDAGARFTVELGAGRGYANAPAIPPKARMRSLPLATGDHAEHGQFERFAVPAAGVPAQLTTLPGFGDLAGAELGVTVPEGQHATFTTTRVQHGIDVIGTPKIRLQFAGSRSDALAFVRLVDVAQDGRRIATRGLVAPVHLRHLPPLSADVGAAVDVSLPPIAWRLAPGHHFDVEIASTDAGYVAPEDAAVLAVAPLGSDGLVVPIVDTSHAVASDMDGRRDWRDLLLLAAALVLAAIATGFVAWRVQRRRIARLQESRLRDTPLVARGLTKRYRDGRLAVDDVSFDVSPGTVVGIVGPNGAGKTTTVRMLLGLIRPTSGTAHVFGQLVRPGAPNLSRVGALVDGPGLLPHLTGREHLERYWSATGRPRADARIDDALAAVDLAADADRTVRTWSHGMRQRLGIAQALLGRPALVVLDEPANGLDPAQIVHLRDLIRGIAADGRSALVSSHLLGELQQVCTHVLLMANGRVLRAGPIDEVIGEHDDLEAAFLALLTSETTKEDDDARDS